VDCDFRRDADGKLASHLIEVFLAESDFPLTGIMFSLALLISKKSRRRWIAPGGGFLVLCSILGCGGGAPKSYSIAVQASSG
jgi:hypothetical protein